MSLVLIVICFAILCLALIFLIRRAKERRDLEQHSISADALHALLTAHPESLVFDVRQPLDLLADSEIIPGAKRIPPREVIKNPVLIPREEDAVIYCTCPSDKTSKAILRRARAAHFSRIKFLKGGIDAWKAAGYPVERYKSAFHLDNA
jgi:rhodanese-related sulfurtransferase